MQKSGENQENSRVVNVYSTNKKEFISRYAMLDWINEILKTQVTQIEELCTGAAYCQLMDMLFPRFTPMKKVKFDVHHPTDFTDNFKLLQTLFRKLNVDKVIPIDKLVQGRFQDNFEFMQWFKRFFEANWKGRIDYDPLSARFGKDIRSGYVKIQSAKGSSARTIPSSKKGNPQKESGNVFNKTFKILKKKAPFTVAESRT